jgi:hypothetical protein
MAGGCRGDFGNDGTRVAQDGADLHAPGAESARITPVDQPIVVAGLRAFAAQRKAAGGARLRHAAA